MELDPNFVSFGEQWKMKPIVMRSIYILIDAHYGRYKLVRGILLEFGVNLSERQLRYFYNKVKLDDRIRVQKKGRPANYTELLSKL
jgi:hypothetical protein